MTIAKATPMPDWKVTVGYRILLKVGWGSLALAVYLVVVASVVGIPEAWWFAAGTAALSLLITGLLPEPVPTEFITGGRNRISAHRSGSL